MEPLWQFKKSLDADRINRLLGYKSYEEVIDLLVNTLEIIGYMAEEFKNIRLKGCVRASFLLKVPNETYDAFFNSPNGYRSQYAHGIETGENANKKIIERLAQNLIAYTRGHVETSFDISKVEKSLHGQDSKIWIYEDEVSEHLGDDDPEILYDAWSEATENDVGLRAPIGTKLEVKGGWLDSSSNEQRDPIKSKRSSEIHRVGYS